MIIKGIALLFLGTGIFVLVQVIMPYLAFQVWELTFYKVNTILIDPSPQKVLGISIEQIGNFPALVSRNKYQGALPYKKFELSVPKIDLFNINVLVESNDFEHNLAHLPGSALPGEKGNVFISGHSSLTQFYRPGNFSAIFANLQKVQKGDEIEVNALGQSFKYTVEGLKIVDPGDTSVINPPERVGRYLSLMTCVPPGFNTKRLVVLAKLKN